MIFEVFSMDLFQNNKILQKKKKSLRTCIINLNLHYDFLILTGREINKFDYLIIYTRWAIAPPPTGKKNANRNQDSIFLPSLREKRKNETGYSGENYVFF